jgi:hypothetical protein
MKHALLVGTWFFTALISLVISATTIHFLRKPRYLTYTHDQYSNQSQPVLAFKKLANVLSHNSLLESDDARPILISRFLEKHNSPLHPYDHFGSFFVTLSDKYGLDYRLLPAIAMQESNLCKAIPQNSFNCLGLGIHSEGTWHFENYESNFEAAAKILRENYIDAGLITPDQIQDRYTPSSNGSWEFAVNQFMNRIETGDY